VRAAVDAWASPLETGVPRDAAELIVPAGDGALSSAAPGAMHRGRIRHAAAAAQGAPSSIPGPGAGRRAQCAAAPGPAMPLAKCRAIAFIQESIPMLFDPVSVRSLQLKNRCVMAPMTRSRAVDAHTANALMAEYYAQRASAGLIVTEGTSRVRFKVM
jgi:hypothetical protein